MSYTGTGTPAVTTYRHNNPVEVLQDLIRFDTTNPPGGERACMEWVCELLSAYDIEYETYANDPDRPTVVARIPGGNRDPLLLYGHVDVVPASGDWTHPPFEGVIEDGCVWGRGAIDMKGGVAMFLTTFLRYATEDIDLPGDLVLCLIPDEEAGGDEGMGFMVDEHPEVFEDIEYSLGEFGGFTMEIQGEHFYPIQVNEKQVCWLEVTITGQGGHGSMPSRGDAIARMGRFVTALDETRLPVHIDPTTITMIEAMRAELGPMERLLFRGLTSPRLTDRILDRMGEEGRKLDALFHNIVNETIISGGNKENVIPDSVTMHLDCRLLPGQTPEDVIEEIETVVGDVADHVEFELIRFDSGPPEPDMARFPVLAETLESADPAGTVIPLLLAATSDARHLSRVDVQSYGFTPMNLPADFPAMELVHATDERIPVECIEWGTERVYEAIPRMWA